MSTQRLEGFSDAVLAIVMTIMVLELKVPHGADLASLQPLLPVFLSYVMSFVYLAIYWNNHHHMLQATERANGAILWANMHLLFWLSLISFATGWMGENAFAPVTTAVYGVVLLMAAVSYLILQGAIIRHEGEGSRLKRMVGKDVKGKLSFVVYAVAIPLAFVSQWIAIAIYVGVALVWLVPDKRIESNLVSD